VPEPSQGVRVHISQVQLTEEHFQRVYRLHLEAFVYPEDQELFRKVILCGTSGPLWLSLVPSSAPPEKAPPEALQLGRRIILEE
jgi:hypothetical protein